MASNKSPFWHNGTLAERWNGKGWVFQPTPLVANTQDNQLQGVSCTSPKACTAVGSYLLGMRIYLARAEQWNGVTWALETLPSPSGVEVSSLHNVSCVSPTACTGVGIISKREGVDVALVEGWNYYQDGSGQCAASAPADGGSGADLYSTTTPATSADPAGETTTFTYYPGDQADVTTNPTGSTTDTYDAAGDLTSVSCSSIAPFFAQPSRALSWIWRCLPTASGAMPPHPAPAPRTTWSRPRVRELRLQVPRKGRDDLARRGGMVARLGALLVVSLLHRPRRQTRPRKQSTSASRTTASIAPGALVDDLVQARGQLRSGLLVSYYSPSQHRGVTAPTPRTDQRGRYAAPRVRWSIHRFRLSLRCEWRIPIPSRV